SYLFTRPSVSQRRVCSSSAYSSCCPVVAPAKNVRLNSDPPNSRRSRCPSGVRLNGTPMRSSKSMILGPQLHISSSGGWSARKSPPSAVSSKCIHSLYPCCRAISLQALIPPCAQTECERLTGTIENRSTSTPSSASLIVQASPAKPPP